MRLPSPTVVFCVVCAVLAQTAGAFVSGDGQGSRDRDCYIGLDGYAEEDLAIVDAKGKKLGIRCTDCDPSCDLDGAVVPDGSCTFRIAACVNVGGVPGCDPAARTPRRVKAQARSRADTLDLAATLPDDLSSACSAFVDFEVPVKARTKGNRPGKGTVKLRATKPADKDTFTFFCEPPPPGATCPTPTTTTTSTTTTTRRSDCFHDTGLTVIDACSGLEWERKAAGAYTGLHDVDNRYSWAGVCELDSSAFCQPNAAAAATCSAQTGGAHGCSDCPLVGGPCDVDPHRRGAITTIWNWINQVNEVGFAGYDDWRLATSAGVPDDPTGEQPEHESIVDRARQGECRAGTAIACIDPVFGPTATEFADGYWTASSAGAIDGWLVYFGGGFLEYGSKDLPAGVRAVRSSSPPP
jgi:hypothetical protein